MVDPQNYELEEKPIDSLPCINFTNVKDFEQTHVLGNMIDKDVLYNNKISLNEISSIKTFPESSNFLRLYDEMSNQFIESYSFQSNFHDPFYARLEESYLKRFHFHFPFFENNGFDLIFSIFQHETSRFPILIFNEFHFSELEMLQWLHWLFDFT